MNGNLVDDLLIFADEGCTGTGCFFSLIGLLEKIQKELKEAAKKAFKAFRRLFEGDSREAEGFGLGLAIADSMCEHIGAKFRDRNLDASKEFQVLIPKSRIS